ncbi:MAG: hypothetical protein QGG73_00850 [Candidatus Hydrogenedentes bacterium]|jgi:hypothetical protein|nr:hypothetical protein [Candidatus Hydrogenedentota bacterium]
MATSNGVAPPTWKRVAREVGYVLLGAWIFGGAILYYLRFTTLLYEENRGAVDAIRSAIGLGS